MLVTGADVIVRSHEKRGVRRRRIAFQQLCSRVRRVWLQLGALDKHWHAQTEYFDQGENCPVLARLKTLGLNRG